MNNVNILHLSDLHINFNEDSSCSILRESLIEDINKIKENKNIKIDIVAMTGDIIDKGTGDKSYALAEEFFNELASKCEIEKEKFLFVPGNHDIPRKSLIKHQLHNKSSEDLFKEDLATEYWDLASSRFNSFNTFVKNFTGREDFLNENLGGAVTTFEINSKVIRFLLINSSWCSLDNEDYGLLKIGKWQLERIRSLINKTEPTDLTFALMHHPIDWLTTDEQKLLTHYLTDTKYIQANYILNGHIHTGKIETTTTPDSTLASLVTGIGYPNKGEKGLSKIKNGQCRYSIYNFNFENNLLTTYLRISLDNGYFVADTQLYQIAGEDGSFTKNIYPQNHTLLKNNYADNFDISSIEVDSIKKVSDWVGREEEFTLIESKKISVLAITGTGGQGKSALASEILRRYSRGSNKKYDVGIWIDCRELPHSLHYKIIETLEKLTDGKESVSLYRDEKLEDTINRLEAHLKIYKLLIVFDNIDAYVNVDTEQVSKELEPFLNCFLNIEHNSFIIFTCRPSLIYHNADFHSIKLTGLSEEDGIQFFNKRGIKLEKNNSVEYSNKIISMTQGHPYWLGLIAGQVAAGRDNFKKLIENYSVGQVYERARLQEYFKSVWDQLSKDRQRLLRYLVEAHRPLNQLEISILENGPDKIRKELRRLERFGLVEPHESVSNDITSYQVHPLVREFIHETYTPSAQEQYVQKVLYVFLPRNIVDILFNKNTDLTGSTIPSPSALLESLETCLNSRNSAKALTLMEQYKNALLDNGYHHQSLSISCRILDSIDWNEHKIAFRSKSVLFLRSLIRQLIYFGDKTYENYLKKYETLVEPNTLPYLRYLTLLTDVEWRIGNYNKSIHYSYEYEKLANSLDNFTEHRDIKYTRALSLRDFGEVEEALSLFNELKDTSVKEAEYLGNCAKCYHKLGDFDKAETLIKQSLELLLEDSSYSSFTNLGYAYLWYSEIMYDKEDFKTSKELLFDAKDIWEEYAPGFTSIIHNKIEEYSNNSIWNSIKTNNKNGNLVFLSTQSV
ncbi:metallophosphoesterase [Lysinibacillus antri]|uniref:metallophosphoesterase n=1 Tax=Lysinibacillus antri TaxID=2498145 RepID=UPI001319BAAE|nr:metallophosphoesterase [Lysinibacillus antri]